MAISGEKAGRTTRLILVLATLMLAVVVAGCGGGSTSTSELQAMEKHLDEASGSYNLTLAVDEVAVGNIPAAKRQFEKACPDDDPGDLVGKAAELAAEEGGLSLAEYKAKVEDLC
jgi:hypothetical protein